MENKLYVGNLPYTASETELQTLFSKAGVVQSVTLITDRETGRSKGFGFVEMESEADAQKAISMLNGTQLDNRTLTVNVARHARSGAAAAVAAAGLAHAGPEAGRAAAGRATAARAGSHLVAIDRGARKSAPVRFPYQGGRPRLCPDPGARRPPPAGNRGRGS